MFKLGEIKIPCDQDLQDVIHLCNDDSGWNLDYNKKNVKVYLKKNELSTFSMIKAKVDFDDIPASVLYNVLMDCDYRKTWDDFMIEGYDHSYITPFSDVGYYCAKSPKPFKNRDFVVQRFWFDFGHNMDKIIGTHSVNHAKMPPIKNRIRGITYLTACYIKFNSPKSSSLYYVTQSDPGGSIPSWVVNMTSKVFTPKFIKKIYKACLKYDKWKAKHNPENKAWENPEMLQIPKIDMTDIISYDLDSLKNMSEDESNIKENDLDKNEFIGE